MTDQIIIETVFSETMYGCICKFFMKCIQGYDKWYHGMCIFLMCFM